MSSATMPWALGKSPSRGSSRPPSAGNTLAHIAKPVVPLMGAALSTHRYLQQQPLERSSPQQQDDCSRSIDSIESIATTLSYSTSGEEDHIGDDGHASRQDFDDRYHAQPKDVIGSSRSVGPSRSHSVRSVQMNRTAPADGTSHPQFYPVRHSSDGNLSARALFHLHPNDERSGSGPRSQRSQPPFSNSLLCATSALPSPASQISLTSKSTGKRSSSGKMDQQHDFFGSDRSQWLALRQDWPLGLPGFNQKRGPHRFLRAERSNGSSLVQYREVLEPSKWFVRAEIERFNGRSAIKKESVRRENYQPPVGKIRFQAVCQRPASTMASSLYESSIFICDEFGAITSWSARPQWIHSQRPKARGHNRWRLHQLALSDSAGTTEALFNGSSMESDLFLECGYSSRVLAEDTTKTCFSASCPGGHTFVARENGLPWNPARLTFSVRTPREVQGWLDVAYFSWDSHTIHLDLRRLSSTSTEISWILCFLESCLAILEETGSSKLRRDDYGRLKHQKKLLTRISHKLLSL